MNINNNLIEKIVKYLSLVAKTILVIGFGLSYLGVSVYAFRKPFLQSPSLTGDLIGIMFGVLCLFMSYVMFSKLLNSVKTPSSDRIIINYKRHIQ